MELGSAQWGNPTAALGQRITQGAGLALSLNQAMQAKKQQDWENNYKGMAATAELMKATKNPEIQAYYFNNQFAPRWKKAFGTDLPPMSAENTKPGIDFIGGLQDIVKNGPSLGPVAMHQQAHFLAGQYAKGAYDDQELAKRKEEITAGLAPFDKGLEAFNKKQEEKDKASAEMTPEKALARISDLERQNADIQKIDQQNVLMMQLMGDKGGDVSKFKVDAAALAARKAAVANEMIQLNTHLPKEQQRIVISSADLPAIQGKLAARGIKNPDEFIAANYIVRPASVGPQQAPEVPPAQ